MKTRQTEALLVFCTAPDETEAERLANTLVEERLAACVNILSQVRSIYRWEGKVEHASECLLLMKTTAPRAQALLDRLVALHSYSTPEFLTVRVEDGLDRYLEWIHQSL